MSNLNELVETLVTATQNKKVNWYYIDGSTSEHIYNTYHLNDDEEILCSDVNGNKICLVKYGGTNEVIDLILFGESVNDLRPALCIEENDISQPHRLWTLYKLAERNATGADRIIEGIISKLSDDIPF